MHVLPNDCQRCGGSGIDPEPAATCCRRAFDFCGGSGCTGQEPQPQPCAFCHGQHATVRDDVQ